MPTTVDVPDFGSIDFPDEMSLGDITSALRKQFPPQSEAESKWVIQDTLSRLGKGVAEQGGQAIQGVARGLSITSAQAIPANLRALQMQAEMAGTDTSAVSPIIAKIAKETPARALQATPESPFYQFGRDIEDAAKGFYQPNPQYDDSIRAKLTQGVSSTVPVLASGPFAPITYAAMMGEQGAREAEEKGATPEQISDTFLANATLGVTSEFLLGVPYLLRSAKAIKGVAAEVSKTALGKRLAALTAKHPVASLAARGAVAEGIQEGPIEQVGQNAIAKFVGQYDTERPIFKDVAEQAAYGAAIGLLLGGLFGGAAKVDKARSEERAAFATPEEDFTFQDPMTGQWVNAADYTARQQLRPDQAQRGVRELPSPFLDVAMGVSPEQVSAFELEKQLARIRESDEQNAIALRQQAERERQRIAAQALSAPENFIDPTIPRPPVADYVEPDPTEKLVSAEDFQSAIISRGRFRPAPVSQITGRPQTVTSAPSVAQPATVETPSILKVGDAQTIMQVPSVLADTKTIGGVRWDLFNGARLKEDRAVVRVIDSESGEVLQLKQFPTFDAAETYYKSETGRAQNNELLNPPPVAKQSLTTETPVEVRGEVKASETVTRETTYRKGTGKGSGYIVTTTENGKVVRVQEVGSKIEAEMLKRPPEEVKAEGQAEMVKKFSNPDRPYVVEDLLDAGHKIEPDGTIWLYHATTKEGASGIRTGRALKRPADAPDSYGVFMSTDPAVAQSYGDGTVVRVRVAVRDLVPDDAFPGTSRRDYSIPTKRGEYRPAEIETLGEAKSEAKPVTPEKKDFVIQESVEANELRITKEKRGLGRLNQERLDELEKKEAVDFENKAATEATLATEAWGKHSVEVVEPLRQKIRKLNQEVQQMAADAQRTKPKTKGKQKLTQKAFLEKYGATSMAKANEIYKAKNTEWAEKEKQLEAAEAKLKELEQLKERRSKEWSQAVTRRKEAELQAKQQADLPMSAAPQQGASTVQQIAAEVLSFLGVQQLPASITVISDPSKPFAAVITNRNTITLNAAKIAPGTVGKVLLEEGLHGVWFSPEVQAVLAGARNAVMQTDIDAERAKRSGLDTDEATLIEEATIAKLVNRSFWNRLLDALKRAFRRLFGIEINPNSYEGLREAAMAFLRGERGNLPGKRLVASNAVVVAPGVSPAYAITAHHGTPHEVDKFSTEKIGTGEGAQVYGWGLYMAQNPIVATEYRNRLAKPREGPRFFATEADARQDAAKVGVRNVDVDKVPEGFHWVERDYGNLYTVTLNVEEDNLLDWDRPLSEQSEKVKEALQNSLSSQYIDDAASSDAKAFRNLSHGDAFRNKGFSGLDIPSQRLVVSGMSAMLKNPEIRKSVVGLVSVNVMDILGGEQGPPKRLLDNPAMFLDLFRSKGSGSVTVGVNSSDSAIRSVADSTGAKKLGVLSDIVRMSKEGARAIMASDFYRMIVSHVGEKSASELLSEQGLSGIRYLDQGSRNAFKSYLQPNGKWGISIVSNMTYRGDSPSFNTQDEADLWIRGQQTYNYVIFNSDDITITHRNGQPVALEEAMGDEVRYAAPTVESATMSENEAINSKAFKANAELADDLGTIRPEDDEEGVRTKVGNVYDQVLSRPGLNNAVKSDSVANAQNALAEAGLVVAQADDGLFELVDNAASQEQAGLNLVTILEREIKSARTENRPERIANLLNTVAVHLARDKNRAFSQATKNRLYALAQGERSAFGRALGSLAMWGKVLANVAQNPSIHLNRIYSQNLGGEEISEVMERLRKILGGSPTAQEVEDALAKIQAEFSKKNRMFEKGNKLWGKIQKAARAGLFDPGPILEDLARGQGWTVPTEGQKAWLRTQVAEEERLRTPTQRQIDNAGGDIDKATSEAAKGTESERLKIIKDIQAHWSRWSMPISWNPLKWTAQTMRNNARAVNEFVAANFLFTPGFPVRQWMDVILTSLPLNAVNRTLVHVLERAQNDGGFSADTTNDLYAASEEMLVSRIASLKATIRAMERTAGGHLNRKVLERMTHSVGVFERMRVKANELKANGNLAGYWALRFASILQAGYRVASVFDESQATGLEWQEMRQQLATDLRAAGKTRAEIATQLDDILGGIRVDMVEAVAETTAIKQERGLPLDKKAIEQDAWALIKARAYDRMRQATGTDAQYEAENTQLRELHSWNLPETGGIGGAIAGTINFIKRYTEKAGIPTGGLFSFGNAMGIAANRMATFSGGGLLGGFGFGDSPWYQGERNIKQRRIEAIEGLAVMGLMVALAAAGKILIMTRYPDDKDEKERFIAEGHKLNTVRFMQDDGRWIEYPIQMSPFSFIASPLYMIGGIQRLLINQQKAQERLNAEAAKTGSTPGQAKAIGPGDVAGVIAQGMYGMLTGGRTATGAIQSFSDYGDFNLSRASSSLVRGYIPGVPAWQTVSRMMGVAMDSKTASVFEQLFPVPGSQHQRVNSLGDPMANANDAVRVLQVLTAGVGFGAESDKKGDYAYRQLAAAGYAAPSIGRGKGYNFGGTVRPLTPKEYERYAIERGKAFKQELEQLGSLDGLGSGEARKAAQGAFQRANQRALASVGVSEVKPKRAYTRRLRSVGGITRRGRQPSLGRIRRGRTPRFGKLRPASAPRINRTVLSGTRRQRVQRIVPANY